MTEYWVCLFHLVEGEKRQFLIQIKIFQHKYQAPDCGCESTVMFAKDMFSDYENMCLGVHSYSPTFMTLLDFYSMRIFKHILNCIKFWLPECPVAVCSKN